MRFSGETGGNLLLLLGGAMLVSTVFWILGGSDSDSDVSATEGGSDDSAVAGSLPLEGRSGPEADGQAPSVGRTEARPPESVEWTDSMEAIAEGRMQHTVPDLEAQYATYIRQCDELRENPEFAEYPFIDARLLDGLSPMAQKFALQLLIESLWQMRQEGGGFPGGGRRDESYYVSMLDSDDVFRVPITGMHDTPYLDGKHESDADELRAAQDVRLRYLVEYAPILARYRTLTSLSRDSAGQMDYSPAAAGVEAAKAELELTKLRRACAAEVLTLLGAERLPEYE